VRGSNKLPPSHEQLVADWPTKVSTRFSPGNTGRQAGASGISRERLRRGMDQAKRMKDIEKENAMLKQLLADAELDMAILRKIRSRFANSWHSKRSDSARC
jgi:hypothetical protein